MKIQYEPRVFGAVPLSVVQAAERICTDYDRQGYRLTLRQLYYRFIATDAFPESRRDPVSGTKNTEKNYKWLGDLVSNARIGGYIDWRHLEDRTRETQGGDAGYGSPQSAVRAMANWYNITHWDDQPEYVEVWVEKEALADVIARPTSRWDVAHFACKGSPSTSSIHDAAQRLRSFEDAGRKTTVVYLGDHDPTGIDISRDIQARLRMFWSDARVDRVALNMDQVLEMNPPPSPVKVTDSRTGGYIEQFGTEECWELDAIEPADLERLVEDAILARLDRELYDARIERERQEKVVLTAISDNFEALKGYMTDEGMIEPEEE
jgi:hypothetical protein